jgi:hypothetical protein
MPTTILSGRNNGCGQFIGFRLDGSHLVVLAIGFGILSLQQAAPATEPSARHLFLFRRAFISNQMPGSFMSL